MSNEIPRRAHIDRLTPAETAIREAVVAVEAAGCDVRLTRVVVKLQEARDMMADFVDGIPAIEDRCVARAIVNGTDQGRCARPRDHVELEHLSKYQVSLLPSVDGDAKR